MELKKLETRADCNKGREIQVNGWDGKPTDFYITVVGIDSDKWQKVQREGAVNRLKGEGFDEVESMASATIGWRGLTDGDKEVPFSHEAAVSLYREAPYLGEQIISFMVKRENFMKPLKKG